MQIGDEPAVFEMQADFGGANLEPAITDAGEFEVQIDVRNGQH